MAETAVDPAIEPCITCDLLDEALMLWHDLALATYAILTDGSPLRQAIFADALKQRLDGGLIGFPNLIPPVLAG